MDSANLIIVILAFFTAVAGIDIEKLNETHNIPEPIDLNWEAPKDIKNRFIYYTSGYDYDYKPVMVLEFGNWDFQGAAENGDDNLATADRFINQLNARLIAGYFGGNYNKSGSNTLDVNNEFVAIVDFDGLKLAQLKSPPTIKWMLNRLALMGSVYKTLAYGFILNATPLVHQLINSVKPFIGNFLEKVEIYGTNPNQYKSHLLRKIPSSELHPRYGGNNDFRPVAVYG